MIPQILLKNKHEKDGSDFENKINKVDKKIPDVSNLIKKKTDSITEIEGKIPSISGLATNSALTAVENKIPDVSSLVKKDQILKIRLLITIITNKLLFQKLTLWQQMFLMQD